MHGVGLTWVLVDGQPRRVAEFASLPPRRRPRATCPACGQPLVLKLGRVRRHHAAHAADASCVATTPETVLHLDVKLALAAVLGSVAGPGSGLALCLGCAPDGAASCAASHVVDWVAGWDEVRVEASVGASDARPRPDLLLLRRGAPVAAVEVLASHRVPEEKAALLARLGVPWVEVRAEETLLDRLAAWPTGEPLPAVRAAPSPAPDGWRCGAHERRETVLRAARVVDVYRAGGRRDRRIYRIDELRVERAARGLALGRDGREVAVAPYDGSAPSRRRAWGELQYAFAADLDAIGTGDGAFHDSPMRWATGDAAANLVHEGLLDVAPGDSLPLATRYPRRWFYAREQDRWFLPPDMQHVRWDRPEADAFAAHPAWQRSRAAVRERPVPIEAWKGQVFARRPVASAFAPPERIAQTGSIAVVSLEPPAPTDAPRVLVVVSDPTAEAEVRRMAATLRERDVEHLWLSHPMDWHAARADLPWAAAGRDAAGRAVVVVDGLGVYRAEAFARAFARGDGRLRVEAIVRHMADRVAALR